MCEVTEPSWTMKRTNSATTGSDDDDEGDYQGLMDSGDDEVAESEIGAFDDEDDVDFGGGGDSCWALILMSMWTGDSDAMIRKP